MPFCNVTAPAKFLHLKTFRGGTAWAEVDTPLLTRQRKHFLASGDVCPGIVISHDYDLDKLDSKVLLAPVASLQSLETATRATVREQRHLALLPLPLVPGLGDSYADLRLITPVPRELVLDSNRVVSMNPDGVDRLHAQLARFIMRRERPAPDP
jgi:hypothetical protein